MRKLRVCSTRNGFARCARIARMARTAHVGVARALCCRASLARGAYAIGVACMTNNTARALRAARARGGEASDGRHRCGAHAARRLARGSVERRHTYRRHIFIAA